MKNNLTCSRLQRFFVSFIIVFILAKVTAQNENTNQSKTIFYGSEFQIVDINLKEYLQLTITTTENNQFKINTSQNGEYKDAIVLSSVLKNDSIIITDPISASFQFPQDKLSAHKVIDGRATLYIPKNKSIIINTRSADIDISGNYRNIYVNQLDGSFKIHNTQGNINFISVYANAHVHLDNYKITALSKSGIVSKFQKPELIQYNAQFESISGNITLLKKFNN